MTADSDATSATARSVSARGDHDAGRDRRAASDREESFESAASGPSCAETRRRAKISAGKRVSTDFATGVRERFERRSKQAVLRQRRVVAVLLIGPHDDVLRPRMGDRTALPDHVPAPGGEERVRLPRAAAAARSPRRARLHASDRAGARRGPRSRRAMVPRAEIAHWLAGSAVLLLGLVLLSEVDRRHRGVPPARAGARTSGRRSPSRAACCSGSSSRFSTFSTMHLVAHAVWAQVAMVAGAVQLAIVRGKLASPRWPLVISGGLSRCAGRVRPARAERLALLALGVPPPRPRVDAHRGSALPAGAGASGPEGRSSRRASR